MRLMIPECWPELPLFVLAGGSGDEGMLPRFDASILVDLNGSLISRDLDLDLLLSLDLDIGCDG